MRLRIGILASSKKTESNPSVVDPLGLKSVGVAEYSTVYLRNNGTVATVTGNDNGYSLQNVPLSDVIQVEGGQYHSIFLTATKQVFSILGGSLNVKAYPLDVDNQPFTCDYVQGIYKNMLALKNGELWYWCSDHPERGGVEDVLNQGYTGIKPKKLIQPSGKTLVKIVSGANTNYALAYVLALASDGTVWKWDRSNKTPVQVTAGWTGVVRDLAVVGPNAYVIETTTGQLWSWGYLGNYTGGQAAWQNPNPQNITSQWTSAGCVFPSKQLATTYNTLHIIDANNNLFGSGSNVQGNIGNGKQWPSWRTYSPKPYVWSLTNDQVVQAPTQIRGKFKKLYTNNTVAFYVWAQDMGDKFYSWGRNKARVLGNGITLNVSDEEHRSEYLNEPAPKKRTPLSQSWSVLPTQDNNANRAPIAHAGIDQYLAGGTTTANLYAEYSHQQQPTAGSTTITMSYSWSQISGPNSASITSPTSMNTGLTGLINGEYVFRVTVTNSVGLTNYHETTIKIG